MTTGICTRCGKQIPASRQTRCKPCRNYRECSYCGAYGYSGHKKGTCFACYRKLFPDEYSREVEYRRRYYQANQAKMCDHCHTNHRQRKSRYCYPCWRELNPEAYARHLARMRVSNLRRRSKTQTGPTASEQLTAQIFQDPQLLELIETFRKGTRP